MTELHVLYPAGFTNRELLVALTRNTTNSRDEVRDFVVPGNPLSSIEALRNVKTVVRAGQVVFAK